MRIIGPLARSLVLQSHFSTLGVRLRALGNSALGTSALGHRALGRSGALVTALALCTAVAAPACIPSAAAPALATGERPVTGVPRFDRLFADVHASLLAVQEARSEEVEARGALARRLGLTEATPVDGLGARLRERTARLAQDGLTLELEFTGIDDGDGLESNPDGTAGALAEAPEAGGTEPERPLPTATLRTPGREPQRRELRLLEALAQAALSGATIYANMGRERRHTERLLGEVVELEERVDASFLEPSDRERVRAKLAEAKSLLPQIDSQAREVAGHADILISLLDEAANTAPVVPTRRRSPGPPKIGTPRPPPSAPGASPGAGAPAAGVPAPPSSESGSTSAAAPASAVPQVGAVSPGP
jgi:hypothetical protein